jgi:hypothetical protein
MSAIALSGPLWPTLAPQPILEVKAAERDGWEVSGYASVFDTVDLTNDVVHKGAFAASLGSGRRVRFLYQHDQAQILGRPLDLREDDKGLFGRWRISNTPLGQAVHTLLEDEAIDSFSIGFRAGDYDRDQKTGTRHLKAIDLFEVSLVAVPALPDARVTDFKAEDYQTLGLDALLSTYDTHRGAALAQAKAVAERRLAEGRKLSDQTLATLERLRALSLDDAAEFLRLATTPPSTREALVLGRKAGSEAKDADPAPVETASLVEAHLRRARLNELRRAFDLPPLGGAPLETAT